ncbi:PorP/SprF family type IX secretion system membrane protein [Lishizhenia sp.]|uniref:PorP/SprF family type IX secretion system membrane protein n=1 Tax=Lishizhenia sp. TaxID=2497594 RepID=UPI00299E1D5B|nr:PorP/SprF family type IX secretion system membrane protein [Lishizhenia sp.]MDX1445872.1 PorP/SprF family type IX secretion system membrane protein [Lishizhenia sp.]
MDKRLLFVASLLLCLTGTSFAQQEKLLTHFIFDKMSLNPGATGITTENTVCATSIYRNQWDRVNGAPNSAVLNVEANLQRFFPSAAGISFYHDAIGFYRQNNVVLNYAYHQPLSNGDLLGIGLGIGISSMSNTPTWVTPQTQFPAGIDPLLYTTGYSQTNVDMNFGVYYHSDKNFYAGVSGVHLNAAQFDTAIGLSMSRHFYLMGGKYFEDLIAQDIDLEANVLVRTDLVKTSADVNVRALYQDRFYGGLTFRANDAVAIMLGMIDVIPNLNVGYSYDATVNKLRTNSWGSHELMVKYCYMIPPPPREVTINPRWL